MKIKLQNELLLLNALTILLIIIIVFTPSNVLRIILGLPFILFFPGYTFAAALFPGRDAINSVERVSLSFGLSIAMVILIGIMLNYTPWGIKLYPVLISVTIFIIATSVIAWYRRRRLGEAGRFNIPWNFSLVSWREQNPIDKMLSVILIVVILIAAGTLGYLVAKPIVKERFTNFYVLGQGGKFENYPKETVVGEEAEVIVRIENHERETVTYWLEVRIDGVTSKKVGPLVLGHDEIWEQMVSFTPPTAGNNQKVEFILYKNDEDVPYLKPAYLWINAEELR